ncbi:histidine phosphatase family protein [Sporolactobacillus shoreicorticis]|uniref:Histidine phosphatase family protein n=1 Tax=Sporolactobacillus shoreicorticis TaxID=1923877 RepID=A0ABW5S0N4_9BACL|nr:histidine phosphatase family protein [Sporolactobacillus shoreicorticis]MCO7126993.1 histidine phosphatase family protein [Sporolactobacillus shoreicorticis]
MKTFYIVRHGETLLNLLNRSQGWADSPLTKKGIRQAVNLGEKVRQQAITFDAAFSSDTGRARQTAQVILDHSGNGETPIKELFDLREASFGLFEGADNDEMWEEGGKAVGEPDMSRKSPIDQKIKALTGIKKLDTIDYAEDFHDLKRRILALKHTMMQTEAANILVVTHSLYICCMLYVLIGEDLTIGKVPNCSVTKMTYNSNKNFKLEYIGRTQEL